MILLEPNALQFIFHQKLVRWQTVSTAMSLLLSFPLKEIMHVTPSTRLNSIQDCFESPVWTRTQLLPSLNKGRTTADDLQYYGMFTFLNGCGAKRRAMMPRPAFEALGIGTRSCFAFRPPPHGYYFRTCQSRNSPTRKNPTMKSWGCCKQGGNCTILEHFVVRNDAALTSGYSTTLSHQPQQLSP